MQLILNTLKKIVKKNNATSLTPAGVTAGVKPTEITFSVVTKAAGEGILTKKMTWDGIRVMKDSSQCGLSLGTIETHTCSISRFAKGLRNLAPNQALVHGISGHGKAIICSRNKLEDVRLANANGNEPVICRTKDDLSYLDGAGLMMFDHDKPRDNAVALHKKAIKSLSPAELMGILNSIHPENTSSAWVSTPSTSSCIFSTDGVELRGEGDGFHLYLFPKNAQDIPRFMGVLGQRLILAGFGRIEFSKTGSMLIRTILDLSVGSPERLDFAAGAVCGSGLEQRLPEPFFNKGSLFDTHGLPDLTTKENLKYNDIVRELKNKAEPERKKIQTLYVDQNVKELIASGMKAETAKARVAARIDGVLGDEVVLYLENGTEKTVGEFLNDGSRFDGVSMADPLEPEYGGWSRNKAKFYWNNGEPRIQSFAHGSSSYKFSRYDRKIKIENVQMDPVLSPINPNRFADYVSDSIKLLNPEFHCRGVIREVFIQSGNIYNHCVMLNKKGESVQLVNATATGSGKTVSMIEYTSRVAVMGFSSLLVVSEIKSAIEIANRINFKAGKNVAGVHYTVSSKHQKDELWFDINNLPIVTIITHAMFIQRSETGKEIEFLRHHNGKQRNLVVVDERIDLVKRVSFKTEEIPDTITILNRDRCLKDISAGLSVLTTAILNSPGNGSYEYTGQWKNWCTSFSMALEKVIPELKNDQYDLRSKIRGRSNVQIERENVAGLLERIRYVISDRFTQISEGKIVVCHREECLANKFGSVVVLDATSSINPVYVYRELNDKNIMSFSRIPSRNYSCATINLCNDKTAKQSKFSLLDGPIKNNNLNNVLRVYLNCISSCINSEDKVLVATYKDLVPFFENINPFSNVKFVYWGSSDTRGSNQFKDYNKAFIIGWFRKPLYYYSQSIGAINDFDRYCPANGSKQSDARHLMDMLIIDDMIQFFNRIRCRTSVDDRGNCLPVDLYCFTGGSEKMKELIISSCKNEMPNINIVDWEPEEKLFPARETVPEKTAKLIGQWLRGKIGFEQEIYLKEVKKAFKLSTNAIALAIKTGVFEDLLDEEGIVFIPSRGGPNNPARFILPPHTL